LIGIPRKRGDPGAGRTGEEKEEKKKEEKKYAPPEEALHRRADFISR
jgi:hypothetical protein